VGGKMNCIMLNVALDKSDDRKPRGPEWYDGKDTALAAVNWFTGYITGARKRRPQSRGTRHTRWRERNGRRHISDECLLDVPGCDRASSCGYSRRDTAQAKAKDSAPVTTDPNR
jgi:hypothetical protein